MEVALLVCDKPEALVIEKAENENIKTFVINPKEYETKASFEQKINSVLLENGVDLIVLAGYMRLIGSTLLTAYKNKIINIHPSLLPSFPGKDAIGQAFRAGVKITGVTIHYVDEGMDTGPIIAQRALELSGEELLSEVEQKIHEIEHVFYPEVLQKCFVEKN